MRILIALTMLTTFLASPFVFMAPAYAQGVEGLEEIDVEKSAFPDTKQGCTKKALFRVAMADLYKRGKDPKELTDMKILEPLVQGVYEEIGQSGLTPFNLKTLTDYQECGEKAKADSRAAKEEKYAAIYSACTGVNKVTLEALESAKRKRSKDATISKLGKTSLDVKGTSLEKMEDPALYLAEQIFSKNDKSYDDAVEFAVHIGTDCLNRKN